VRRPVGAPERWKAAGRFCHGGALSSAPDLVARVFEGPHDRFRLSHCKERVQATSAALSLLRENSGDYRSDRSLLGVYRHGLRLSRQPPLARIIAGGSKALPSPQRAGAGPIRRRRRGGPSGRLLHPAPRANRPVTRRLRDIRAASAWIPGGVRVDFHRLSQALEFGHERVVHCH
jgi:hypothetical protein